MKIALALSGGGTRAAVFHLGVLNRLARDNKLEHIARLSTVSGGSIVASLVFCHSGHHWPTSGQFLEEIYPKLMKLLTEVDLFSGSAVLRSPKQWPYLFGHRARMIANLLEARWKVCGKLSALPATPLWLINTTCVETGKNWRFSANHMGDWKFGHHYAPPFTIAEAVAASAAVPYVIGSLRLKMPKEKWFKINPATDIHQDVIPRLYESVSLWDGGAYENLGLEGLWKEDRGVMECDHILVSDASAPLQMGRPASPLAIFKGKLASPRLFDVASDQIRSLRSRMLMHALREKKVSGAIIRLGHSAREIDMMAGKAKSAEEYRRFQEDAESAEALNYPTHLSHLEPEEFQLIARHGFEVTDLTLCYHCPAVAPNNIAW